MKILQLDVALTEAARAYAVKTIEFSPDGTKLAVAQSDNIVQGSPRAQMLVLNLLVEEAHGRLSLYRVLFFGTAFLVVLRSGAICDISIFRGNPQLPPPVSLGPNSSLLQRPLCCFFCFPIVWWFGKSPQYTDWFCLNICVNYIFFLHSYFCVFFPVFQQWFCLNCLTGNISLVRFWSSRKAILVPISRDINILLSETLPYYTVSIVTLPSYGPMQTHLG